jgi:hypothetical protein
MNGRDIDPPHGIPSQANLTLVGKLRIFFLLAKSIELLDQFDIGESANAPHGM